ncbi:hypothetical protein NF867_02250 [Solitalea sp. MAHUQ-68]|uniref:Uncharacterized protein n=1 Tax=Solitalea agri TaxID=2953739 RepID=A0A9X2JAQ4_9SPHI|nr:hypothetical protein [Solitalea agri]MCO4291682.1 hypothetical protein [Solitalea agri]
MGNLSRKKFIFSGISLAAIIAFFKWDNPPKEKKNVTKTVKFLTQDGKLVEIDMDKLPTTAKTATKEDVQNWVKK